jgi:hypothetical protein
MRIRPPALHARGRVLAGLSVALVATLAACSAPAESPSSSPTDAAPPGESAAAAPDKEFLEWQLSFAECMRGEGVEQPDPGKDGSVSLPLDTDPDAYAAAAETCEATLGPPPAATEESDQAVLDEELKSAQCLRDEGYDVEDPKPGEPFGIPAEASSEALQKCLNPTGD